jgi:hypothetical protein
MLDLLSDAFNNLWKKTFFILCLLTERSSRAEFTTSKVYDFYRSISHLNNTKFSKWHFVCLYFCICIALFMVVPETIFMNKTNRKYQLPINFNFNFWCIVLFKTFVSFSLVQLMNKCLFIFSRIFLAWI